MYIANLKLNYKFILISNYMDRNYKLDKIFENDSTFSRTMSD